MVFISKSDFQRTCIPEFEVLEIFGIVDSEGYGKVNSIMKKKIMN